MEVEELALYNQSPSFIWNYDKKNSELNKSKIAIGARKVSDLSVKNLKTSKTKQTKKSSNDKNNLIEYSPEFNQKSLTQVSQS